MYFCFIDYAKVFDCVDHNKLWKILKVMGIPDHLTCLLRHLYECQECSNYSTIALISHASKVMLKILQDRLQQHVNHELPDIQAGFRTGRGTRDQIANIHWIIKKQESSRKHLLLLY